MTTLDNDAYGHTVTMDSDGTIDTYTVGGSLEYIFATGTSQATAYLSMAKQFKLSVFQDAVKAFVTDHYALDTRFNFMALYLTAGLKLNRQAYVAQLLTWATSVVGYAATFVATVNAMSDPAVVAAAQWNFAALDSSDPKVTPIAAVAINT